MSVQLKQYLHALVHWAEEVEQKVTFSDHLIERSEWFEKIQEWKAEIDRLIQEEKVSEEQVNEIKTKGEELIQELQAKGNRQERVQAGRHKLPPLPYAYNALEPYIAEKIMRLHHDVHHKGYVDGLNKAEKMIANWKESQNDSILRHWLREQSFNGSGHFLHTIFWNNMTPKQGSRPKGALLQQIKKDFSTYERFKKLFTHAAQSVQGSGWAMLIWEIQAGRLAIQTVEKHNMYALWDVIPLLVLDLWEHAYYLQYETDRNKYIENWWNIVNWEDVEERFNKAKSFSRN